MMDSNGINNPSLMPVIGPDGLPREAPVIAYTERIIEEEQLQLRKYIEENYTKIRDVEREFSNLTMEMKLTAGPKKAALEHMRKKIEVSNEKIRAAKLKEEQARKAWEAASNALKEEESVKQKLCEDLNNLVQESSNSQFARLEELKRRLEALNPSRISAVATQDRTSVEPGQNSKATEASPSPNTAKSCTAEPGNASGQGNNSNIPAVNVQNKQSASEGEAKKKKIQFQGKGRGLGTLARGRGSQPPGWTGAGFDVDGGN